MHPIEPHFAAGNLPEDLAGISAGRNSGAKTSFYPRIIFTKKDAHVGIPSESFSGDRRLVPAQSVDVFCEGCWRRGRIVRVLIKGSRYLVVIGGNEGVPVEVCGSQLRVSRVWNDGSSWNSPLDSLQKTSCLIDGKIKRMQSETEQEGILHANSKPSTTTDVRSNANGKRVKLRIKQSKTDLEAKFSLGTTVEVRSDKDGYLGSWYTATIVGSVAVGKFLVEYKSLKTHDGTSFLRGIANEEDIRPYPPKIPQSQRFEVLQEVDAWYNEGWWEGVISEVLDEWKYVFSFASTSEKLVYLHSHLRPHQNCVHGKWVRASQLQKESCEIRGRSNGMLSKSEQGGSLPTNSKPGTKGSTKINDNGKVVKLRIKLPQKTMEAKFSPGTTVEVESDEDGYRGSWYTATVIRSVGAGKFLVEYKTLTTDDETELLREVANEEDIRPYPPEIPQSQRYEVLQEVDAWYNDGWWEGVISEVLGEWKYVVYFASTNEKLVCQHSHLRPHQKWACGKWVLSSQERLSDLKLKATPSKRKYSRNKSDGIFFRKGTMIEVKSDEQGYKGSWYSAVIVRSKRNGKFLVEYYTLKTDDGKKLLREETDAQNIRPLPPLEKVDNHYRLLEKVDAWCNGGWWEGLITGVTAVGKYTVFFETTHEEMEFDHINLRKHLEWIDGKWIAADKDNWCRS